MKNNAFDVVIIGAGITGTALTYVLSRYTDLKRIALVEKNQEIAALNSHGRNNSQTLHCGDIETNYTYEKAAQVQANAAMLVRYAEGLPDRDRILYKYPKMVIGVGDEETAFLSERYQQFSKLFPAMRLLDGAAVGEIEPKVIEGRQQRINALAMVDEYSAVNYQALAQSFIEQAKGADESRSQVFTETQVQAVEPMAEGFRIDTSRGQWQAKAVVVAAGGHSLLFAQRMGYGLDYACLPIAGSFYYTPRLLNGKVYTVQNPKLPFAAIHGDPDVLVGDKTRFGPTAFVLPMLERYNYRTVREFFEVFDFDRGVMRVMWDLFKVRDIRNYMIKNTLYEIPLLRNYLFLRDARKIVPSLQLSDLRFAKGIGGIRPVMIDKPNRKLHLGEAKINPGNGLIFNMTPSPGATSCLANAEQDAMALVDYLGCAFHQQQLERELKKAEA
jgi:malate dehydrogenase (quinone)